MATELSFVEYVVDQMSGAGQVSFKKMFGEYALYADGKVVALVCDNQLYVKILPASEQLGEICEKGPPYPGAKPHYIVEEDMLSTLDTLPHILLDISKSLPEKKKKTKSKK